MDLQCPSCGSTQLKARHAHGTWKKFKSLLGFGTIRCLSCDHTFPESATWLSGIPYARCPRCFRDDLSDWAEKYFYPPVWSRMLLYVGAKGHRCPACRVNFVSFLPRRRAYSPSYKQPSGAEATPDSTVSDTVNHES
jgi:DNA-directed RNA polymerase subunit RPC12/RpoP